MFFYKMILFLIKKMMKVLKIIYFMYLYFNDDLSLYEVVFENIYIMYYLWIVFDEFYLMVISV